jgi:hypothetical protein
MHHQTILQICELTILPFSLEPTDPDLGNHNKIAFDGLVDLPDPDLLIHNNIPPGKFIEQFDSLLQSLGIGIEHGPQFIELFIKVLFCCCEFVDIYFYGLVLDMEHLPDCFI